MDYTTCPQTLRIQSHLFLCNFFCRQLSECICIAGITGEEKTTFFRLQGRRRKENENLAYDTCTIPGCSGRLPQPNILLVFGDMSRLPFCYLKPAGDIPEAVAVNDCLKELGLVEGGKARIVKKEFGDSVWLLEGELMPASSEACFEGELFVRFVALIYASYMRGRMEGKKSYDKFTLQGLLDELDVIECLKQPGIAPSIGEVLAEQRQIYLDMDVHVPTL